mgnify:CR=1 FL=1
MTDDSSCAVGHHVHSCRATFHSRDLARPYYAPVAPPEQEKPRTRSPNERPALAKRPKRPAGKRPEAGPTPSGRPISAPVSGEAISQVHPSQRKTSKRTTPGPNYRTLVSKASIKIQDGMQACVRVRKCRPSACPTFRACHSGRSNALYRLKQCDLRLHEQRPSRATTQQGLLALWGRARGLPARRDNGGSSHKRAGRPRPAVHVRLHLGAHGEG